MAQLVILHKYTHETGFFRFPEIEDVCPFISKDVYSVLLIMLFWSCWTLLMPFKPAYQAMVIYSAGVAAVALDCGGGFFLSTTVVTQPTN